MRRENGSYRFPALNRRGEVVELGGRRRPWWRSWLSGGEVTYVNGGIVYPEGESPADDPNFSPADYGPSPPVRIRFAPAPQPPASAMPNTALLFPGQGAQAVGMAGPLCQSHPPAHELFRRASAALGYDLLDLCVNGPAERLNATDVSQPAIFVASLAALDQLRATQPEALSAVTATAGLSLGEYTALVFAGALSFDDGLKVVKARGEAMQAAAVATPSGMVAVLGVDAPEVEALVAEARPAGTLEVANYLCPGNTVASGVLPALDRLEQLCQEKGGIRTARLAVAGAFHTALMKPADDALAAALAGVEVRAPTIPVWSNVDARPHTDPAEIRALLVRQVLSPVRWEDTLRGLMAAGVERFYEVGPGRVLAGLMKRVHRKADFVNVTA